MTSRETQKSTKRRGQTRRSENTHKKTTRSKGSAQREREQSAYAPALLATLEPFGRTTPGDANCSSHEDNKASLSIHPGEEPPYVVLRCHAGCDTDAILSAVGLSWPKLHEINGQANYRPDDSPPQRQKQKSESLPSMKQVEEWHQNLLSDVKLLRYITNRGLKVETAERWLIGWDSKRKRYTFPVIEGGNVVVQLARYNRQAEANEPKFKVLRGHEHTLYMWDDELKEQKFLLWCEGQWDALIARQHGLPGFTTTGGAGTVKQSWIDTVADAGLPVAVVMDCDEPGDKGATKRAEGLAAKGTKVKVVNLGLNEGEDVNDWFLGYSRSKQELWRLINDTPLHALQDDAVDSFGFRLTELGNAERLANEHGDDIRYCHPWKCWLVWDGRRWKKDATAAIQRKAKRTVRAIQEQALAIEDYEPRKSLLKWAIQSETRYRIGAMIQLAESEVPALPAEFDQDSMLLNVLNGTIDLRTSKLRSHRRKDMITKLAPVVYDPKAKCPLFMRSLKGWLPDAKDRAYIQRAIGYSLTGNVEEQVIFIVWGDGGNGKGTFLLTILKIAGDYGQSAPSELFLSSKLPGGVHQSEGVARLQGIRLALASETQQRHQLNEAQIKNLSGGDRIAARLLYGNTFEFDPTHQLWLMTNYMPQVRDNSTGMWRRLKLIEFLTEFTDGERIENLAEQLESEWSGILNWALRGCLAWQKQGLGDSPNVRRATAAYQSGEDVFGSFLGEECTTTDQRAFVSSGGLYTRYEDWAHQNGLRPMSKIAFGKMIKQRGFKSDRQGEQRVRGWHGITLRSHKVKVKR